MAIITVNDLIQRAYRVIGVKSDDRNLSDYESTEGLDVLNELLDSYFADPYLIAYDAEVQFNLVVGQKSYEFSQLGTADVTSNKITHLKKCVLEYSDVSYPVEITKDFIDWDKRRVITRQGRPYQCYLQNENFKSLLIFNILPEQPYVCKIKAKFALDNVSLNTDLEQVPVYYIRFLRYALARELSSSFPGAIWDQLREIRYSEALASIKSKSDKDLLQSASCAMISRTRNKYTGINPY